jgi:hypothetical protein
MGTDQLLTESGRVPPPPRSSGVALLVVLLGIGFILASIGQMVALLDSSRFFSLFRDHPEVLTQLLYLVLWGTSLAGGVVGVGLLTRKEFFRKSGVFLAWISIVGAYGKHPHEGFVQRMHLLSERMTANGTPFSSESIIQFAQAWNISWVTESTLAWGCVVLIMIFEVLLALGVIFVLTRPSVKALFR